VRRSLIRISVLVVLAAGALAAAPSALATNGEDVTAGGTSGQSCAGPCPIVIFAKGSQGGTVLATTEFADGRTTTESCSLAAREQCTLYLDEYAWRIVLRGSSTGFRGWTGCSIDAPYGQQPDGSCHLPANYAGAVCATFGTPDGGDCPPPHIQFYKKGDGRGSVTATNGSVSHTCGALCPSDIWTRFGSGQTVTLTATPTEGSFVRWDLCPNVSANTCTLTLTKTAIVCAVFVKTAAPVDPNCPASAGTNPQPPPPSTLPPNTRITAGPSATRATRSRRATFRFASTKPGSRFVCRLDSKPWLPCRAPKTYTRLKPGVHTFRVRAIDSAGRLDNTPASRRWRIKP
jgi:hypothetical protein